MDIYRVKTVSEGYAVGRVVYLKKNESVKVEKKSVADSFSEIAKFEYALAKCEEELMRLY